MEMDRKMIVEQEQIDIDDEMAEDDDDGEPDDNIWLGSLSALLSPCRPIYHSTRQPLYPELSAERVNVEVLSRLAQKLKAQNQVILQNATGINRMSHVNDSHQSIHFENADVTITKIRRKNPTPLEHKFKTGLNSGNFQPISVARINNGNMKTVNEIRFAEFNIISLKLLSLM